MTEQSPAEALFFAALARPPAERAAYLDAHCPDPAVRARVEKLLAAQPKVGDFLADSPAAATGTFAAGGQTAAPGEPTADFPGRDEHLGAVLAGKYKLIEAIGEGGMGSVFLAQQTEPVKRTVAVKVIKAGMDSRAVLARFEAERQALALMDHPNIARVLDAGTTAGGRPFFIMELVKGVPITQFCDERRLTPRQRLELFVPVCQAIQHAHQKGVIHRDIKPSNVLVALYDDRPVPKVIDFGVAKAAGQTLTDKTLMTGFGAVVGTPEYMSPEQASLNNLDVDTRSDVYSLGVLLYELLTGSTPVDRKALGKAALMEVLRIVREVEATRPSDKLSTSDALPSVAANRGTEPARLSKLMRGELDWLVLKALEKDRTRRYDSANGLARDIQRYLADEVVEARPPTAGYRLRKVVRRHKGQVIAAGLILFALVVGVVGTTLGLIEARRQERLALAAADEERQARGREAERAEGERQAKLDADARRQEAERNLGYAKKGNAILGTVFEGLNPRQIAESGRPLQDVLKDNLTKAVADLDGSALGDPQEVAAMQDTLGKSLLGLGEFDLAVTVLTKARDTRLARLGRDHPSTLTSMSNLAEAYQGAGQPDKALSLLKEALERRTATLGPDHPDSLTSLRNLAIGYQSMSQLDKALSLLKEALERRTATLGPDHPDTLGSMSDLAEYYMGAARDLNKALPLMKEVLERRTAKLGPDHPDTLLSMDALAFGYSQSARFDLAIPLNKEALERRTARFGPDHPDTLSGLHNLALCYYSFRQLDKAASLFEEAVSRVEKRHGRGHPNTLLVLANLGACYKAAGRLAEAIPLFEEAAREMEKRQFRHENARFIVPPAIGAFESAKQYDKADEWRRKWLGFVKEQDGVESMTYARELSGWGAGLLGRAKWAEAEAVLRESLVIREKKQPDVWVYFQIHSDLGWALLEQKKYAEAELLLLKGYEGLKAREKTIPPLSSAVFPKALDRLIDLSTATNKPAEAKKWRAERAKYPFVAPMPRPAK